jgi:hypothetical protein
MTEIDASRGNGHGTADDGRDPTSIPPIDGIDRLVKQIDRLVERRQPGDPWWPVLLFTGEGRDAMLRGYQARLQRGGSSRGWRRGVERGRTSLVPHALRADGGRVDEWEFGDGLVNELEDFMPRRLGRFRAERYWTIRSVLDYAGQSTAAGGASGLGAGGDRKTAKRQLLNWLYSADRGRQSADGDAGPDGADAEGAGQVQQFFDQVIETVWGLPILAQFHRLVWKVGLRAGPTMLRVTRWRRMAWFVERMSEAANRQFSDFATAALHLAERHRNGTDADRELVRDVLVLALLHDFDGASRSSLVRPARRRRSMPFVLLLREVGDGPTDAAHRFLDTLGRVRHRVARTTTLVLASMDRDVAVPLSLAPDDQQVTVADLIQPVREVAEGIGDAERAEELLPALAVDIPTEPHDHTSRAWLKAKTEVQPRRSRGTVAVPLVAMAVIATATVVLGSAGLRWIQGDDPCPGISRPAGSTELIGLSDGTTACSFHRPEDADEGTDRRLAEGGRQVEEMIADANVAIGPGEAHSTIVFLGPFTVPDEPEHPNQSTLRELRAVALAQHDLNVRAERDGKKLPVRVLLANTGDNIAYGPQVARQIVEAAAEDPSIVGVVGIGESRAKSREAIGILGAAGLPVIAGTATADGMVEASSLYFQVGPNNNRIAETMVRFAANYDLTENPEGDEPPADADPAGDDLAGDEERPLRSGGGAVVVAAYDDEYSENLAEDLKVHSTAADREVKHTYFYVREGAAPAGTDGATAYVASYAELARQVCSDLDPERDVILFAGRSEQLVNLLDNISTTPAPCSNGVTVVAGDDVTDLAQNPDFEREKYPFARLYYAAMASPSELAGTPAQNFVNGYKDLFGPDAAEDMQSDISDPALDYDALWALQEAVNGLRANTPGDIDRATVASRLTGRGDVDFNGVSGQVRFDSSGPTGRVPLDKPVLVLELDEVMSEPLLACGRFNSDDVRTRWGGPGPGHDAYPCPTDG